MQLLITPAVQKLVPDLESSVTIEAPSLLAAIIKLELMISKFVDRLPLGLFTKTNQIITDLLTSTEEVVVVKLASLGSGGKNSGIIMGAVMIVAGAVLIGLTGPGGVAVSANLFQVGVGLAIGGALTVLQTLMFKPPTLPGLAEENDFTSVPSYNISAFSNKIGQEYPIPLVYGVAPIAGPILDYEESGILQSHNALAAKNIVAPLVYKSGQTIRTGEGPYKIDSYYDITLQPDGRYSIDKYEVYGDAPILDPNMIGGAD